MSDTSPTAPFVTVVIVSDYAGGEEKSWNDLRRNLQQLSHQTYREPVEFLFVESRRFRQEVPPDLLSIVPSLKTLFIDGETSYQMKNAGASAASGDVVIMLDADCTPEPGWLEAFVETMHAHPEAGAVSGRTTYPGRNLLERILALTGRTYLNRPDTGETWSISNNNAAFRLKALLDHPLSDKAGPFGGRLHAQTLINAGYKVLFEPRARAVHDFESWSMERDVRRNVGYATITMRRLEPNMPLSWMARLGYLSIPLFFISRLLLTWWLCLRYFRDYHVAWYELPAALGVAVAIHVMELPGMVRAVRTAPVTDTAYR